MEDKDRKKKQKAVKKQETTCETCEFYEDDAYDGPTCLLSLDEDEFADFAARQTGNCPYYRFYDEYKTVQKQN